MRNHKVKTNKWQLLLFFLLVISLLCNVYLGYRLKNSSPVATVSLHYSDSVKDNSQEKDELNCLFIGNSITLHPICDYWWGEWGMAASTKDKDYVHQTVNKISSRYNVNYSALNFGSWETMGHDRAETLTLLDSFLNKDLNIVVIQLGENVSDTATLESDYESLIKYVQNHSPNAKIIVISQFWKNEEIDNDKKNACQSTNCIFVDLSDIQGTEYQAGMNTVVYGNDGQQHMIEHDGVSKHPGDKGQEAIADKLCGYLLE